MFNFTPLLGAQSASPASQSLLELDNVVNILIDVGWDASFDSAQLTALAHHVPTISLILLTHPTTAHIGAFAHACKHLPGFASIPVYATTPVINLGRTLLTDLYASALLAAGIVPLQSPTTADTDPASSNPTLVLLEPPTPSEIARYFSRIHALKYSQPYTPLPAPSISTPSDLAGLTIAAYAAGHSLGGTIWHIQHGLESIVYAVDWNQARENLFPGAAWLAPSSAETRGGGGAEVIEPLRRPTALVTSVRSIAARSTPAAPLSRKSRDLTLVALIRDTLAQGGKILLPTDSSSRILELAFLLNTIWRENAAPGSPHSATYRNARVYLATKSAGESKRMLGSMLEWVEEGVRGEVEGGMGKAGAGSGRDGRAGREAETGEKGGSPLDWKYVRLLERKSQVEKALRSKRPCVMLASDASLAWGFSRQALLSLTKDAKNLIILTESVLGGVLDERTGLTGVAKQLWELWLSSQHKTSQNDGSQRQIQPNAARVVHAGDGSVATLSWREFSIQPVSDPAETELYQSYIAQQRQMHGTALNLNGADADQTSPADQQEDDNDGDEDDDASSSSSDDEDDANDAANREHQGRALRLTAQSAHHKPLDTGTGGANALLASNLLSGVNVLLKVGSGVHDFDVRGRRGRERVFPFAGKKEKGDEFGGSVRPGEFLRAEEKGEDTDSGFGGGTGSLGNGAGTTLGIGKRKWADIDFASNNSDGGKRGTTDGERLAKRQKPIGGDPEPQQQQQSHAPDNIDVLIARATGEALGSASQAAPTPNTTNNLSTNDITNPNGDNDALASSDDEASDAKGEADSDFEPDAGLLDAGPRKVVYASEIATLEVRCRLGFVDFAGLAERRDLLMLLPLIQPRKVVLLSTGVAGGQDAQDAEGGMMGELKMECEKVLTSGSGSVAPQPRGNNSMVFVPTAGERLDVSVDTNAWTVKLGSALVRGLVWKEVKGVGVVGVRGRLLKVVAEDKESGKDNALVPAPAADLKAEEDEDEPGATKKRKVKRLVKPVAPDAVATIETKTEPKPDTEMGLEGDISTNATAPATASAALPISQPPALPILDLLTPSSSLITKQSSSIRKPIHVGDLRLAALRHLLLASGHLAEFRGEGSLLVDGCVVVRKLSAGGGGGGRVEVEGVGALGGLVRIQAGGGSKVAGWDGRGGGVARGEGSFYEVRRAVYAGLGVVGRV